MVGFKVKFEWYEVGAASFLHSFFSTIAYRLEDNKWGTRFPYLMRKLYQGKLERLDVEKAIEELDVIKNELKKFSPEKVIWDIENLNSQPPWGNEISEDITDLSNYFVTSDGKDLIKVLYDALETSIHLNSDVEICSL